MGGGGKTKIIYKYMTQEGFKKNLFFGGKEGKSFPFGFLSGKFRLRCFLHSFRLKLFSLSNFFSFSFLPTTTFNGVFFRFSSCSAEIKNENPLYFGFIFHDEKKEKKHYLRGSSCFLCFDRKFKMISIKLKL